MGVFFTFILVVILIIVLGLAGTYLIWKGHVYLSSKGIMKSDFISLSKRKKRILGGLISLTFMALIFWGIVVPIYNSWGTGETEKQMELPDEDFLDNPKMTSFHTTSIDAPPSEVWKWLVQVGGYRAGWYSFTWAENLFGMGVYNKYEIRPEWQTMEVGQFIPYNKKGDCGIVTEVVTERYFVHRWDCYDDDSKFDSIFYTSTGKTIKLRNWEVLPDGWGDSGLRMTWTFYINELPDGKSKLLSRMYLDWTNNNFFLGTFYRASLPIMHSLMDIEMLKQIKNCAEGNSSKYKNTKLPEGGIH